MCLSTELLAMFLTLLGPEIVTREPGRITVHATEGDRVWLADGAQWCTDDPVADDRHPPGPAPPR